MDELASLRAFVRVAETGSFSAAGRLLQVSKSVITKRVSDLENRLNAQLLTRSTRRVALTDEGAAYFERAARIIGDLEDAATEITSRTVGLTGTLRVSCIASFLARQLCRDLRAFQHEHPALSMEVLHNDRVYDPIREGYDLCIQPSDVSGDSIVKRQLVSIRRLLVATPAFLERHGRVALPDDLGAYRFAHNNFIQPGSILNLNGPQGPLQIPIRPVVLSNSIWMIREAVLHGDCVGILPTYFIVEELGAGALVPILENFQVPPVVLSGFYRHSPHIPLKVRLLLKFLLEQYKDLPPWERALRDQA
jgi:DNA-binding transcriptional LysR family regulator